MVQHSSNLHVLCYFQKTWKPGWLCLVTKLWAEWSCASRQGQKIYYSLRASIPTLGPTSSPNGCWYPLSLELKQPGHKPDHAPLSSAKVKNAWSCTSVCLYVCMMWFPVKHRDHHLQSFNISSHLCVLYFVCSLLNLASSLPGTTQIWRLTSQRIDMPM